MIEYIGYAKSTVDNALILDLMAGSVHIQLKMDPRLLRRYLSFGALITTTVH